MDGYLAQPRYRWEDFGPTDVSDFVDSPWEAISSLRRRWEGSAGKVGGWEGGGGLGLVYKMIKACF